MSATVQAMAEAISAQLGAAPYNIRAEAYLADVFTPPIALVAIDEVPDYHATFGEDGEAEYKFKIYLIVPRPSDRASIEALEGYMSTSGNSSILEALETDQTLGGVVANTLVRSSGPMAGMTIGTSGVVYTVVPFTVEVRA